MIWSTEELADRWELEPLSEIADKVGSGATPRGGRAVYPPSGIPFIRSQNVRFEGFMPDGLAFLTDAQAAQLNGARVSGNDVLLNITGASIGRVCVAPSEYDGARVNQHVCIIRQPSVRPSFLAAYLASPQIQRAIAQGNYGATRQALTKEQILELPVPIPSDDEQLAILDVVERAATRLHSSTGHVARARRALADVRRATLVAASSGALTEDWRTGENESAVALLAHLAAQYERRRKGTAAEPDPDLLEEPPNGWDVVTLDLLVERIEAGKSVRAAGRPAADNEWGVIKVSAMSWGNFLQDENKAIIKADLVNPAYEIRDGDLLISRANTTELVGASVHVVGPRKQLLLSDKSLRLVVDENVDKRWLNYALEAPWTRMQFSDRATGTSDSMRNLSQEKILATTLPLPSPDEQREIARRVDLILRRASQADGRVEGVRRTLDRTMQATLEKAFRGELTDA
jgi:type I restriction enzyme S subunit